MKTALCLSGYLSSPVLQRTGGIDVAMRGHQYINERIMDENTDVFIHTWDEVNFELIKKLYQPKQIELQKQKSFEKELNDIDVDWFGQSQYSGASIPRDLSMNFSRKKSVELIDDDYDRVVLARFDLGQRGKEHRPRYCAANFRFNDEFDSKSLYSLFWDEFNHGFPDHWFYSGQKVIEKISSLYDKLFEYYQPESDFVQSVTQGWFDSNSADDYSNEIFKPQDQKTPFTQRKVFPKWACIDNHKTYKWHIKQMELYDTCKFIDCSSEDWPDGIRSR